MTYNLIRLQLRGLKLDHKKILNSPQLQFSTHGFFHPHQVATDIHESRITAPRPAFLTDSSTQIHYLRHCTALERPCSWDTISWLFVRFFFLLQ